MANAPRSGEKQFARRRPVTQHVEVQRIIAAPVEAVWNRYTDHRSWTQWAGLGHVGLDREGAPPPNGVGSVRVFSNMGFKLYEEVLSFDPPRCMTYRIVRGPVPIRDHSGDVTFEPNGSGTLITWRCQFNSRIPGLGRLFRAFITRTFRQALEGLSRTFP